ncbi:hypothetical protein PTKIN_Ptkin18bG0029400 [Pterospermum kingtungense]
MTSQYSTLQNIDVNTRGFQMDMQSAVVVNGKPRSTGNFMRCGHKKHMLWGAQDGKEMESDSNNLVDCMVQSDYPETVDGIFLTLGVGVNTEDRSKFNASNRDFSGKIDWAIHSQLNPSHGQSGYGSSFSHDSKKGAGLSNFLTCAGGSSRMEENTVGLSSLRHSFGELPSVMQNAGESSNVCASASAMKKVDGCSLSDSDLGVAGSTSSDFSLSPLQMLPIPQSHVPHPFLKPGDPLATSDPNECFYDLSGAFSMVHSSSRSAIPLNQGFRSLSRISPIEHSSSQSRLPVQGQLRLAPQPSLSPFITSKYSTLTSNQLPKCNMGSIPGLQCGTSMSAPVLGKTESTSSQYHSGRVIPVAAESQPAMTCNLLARPSLKRKAAQTPPDIHQVQIKKKRSVKPAICSSNLRKAQNSPSPILSIPHVTMTARLARKLSPPSRSSQATPYLPLVQTRPVPPSPHIKWQDSELVQLSGYNCLLCKRNLSYTAEGPVFQPAAPPPVAVLSCGHCFHDLCLQRITPKDQANNPSCIPCVVGDN